MVEIRYGAKNIDDFIFKLENYVLDPVFEKYGNFIYENPKFPRNRKLTEKYKGWYCLSGNFFDYSNAFSIFTDDVELACRLRKLIRKNQKSKAYIKAKNEIIERERILDEARIKRLNWEHC